MYYFLEKAEKFPQRWGFRPQTPVNIQRLEAPPPDPRVVISTQFTYNF